MNLPGQHDDTDEEPFTLAEIRETKKGHRPFVDRSQTNQGSVLCHSVAELDRHSYGDLVITTAPLDIPDKLPDIRGLVDRHNIPDTFITERLNSVTHSFGTRSTEEGAETVWIHLLGVIVRKGQFAWLKSGLVLNWSPPPPPSPSRDPASTEVPGPRVQFSSLSKPSVSLLIFEPTFNVYERIGAFAQSANWETALQDPFLLVEMVFGSWYERLDENAWEVTDSCSEIERKTFQDTRQLDMGSMNPQGINFYEVHAVSKNVMYVIEGLDAALRSLDCAIERHSRLYEQYRSQIGRTTHDALLYRREMFHSTRLRMSSAQQRLGNIINLAFNLETKRSNQIMQQDSHSMKTLSILAMIFLPISTVGTIFGTQFFSSTTSEDGHIFLTVNSQFWYLWAISIPITLILTIGWWMWIKYSRHSRSGCWNFRQDTEHGRSRAAQTKRS